MRYHFDVNKGASPCFDIDIWAPSEPYVIVLPEAVKASEAPDVKSVFDELPSAGSAGHWLVRGLHFVDVWAETRL